MNGMQIGPRIVFVVCCVAALPAVSWGSPQARAQERAEFGAFYDKVTRAEAELFQVGAEALEHLVPPAPDVTLFGVSGGSGEDGWDRVGPRLDLTHTQY